MTRSHQTWQADLELEFSCAENKTLLSRRKHHGPLMVQKALYPEGQDVCHAVILHPPAGIAGGDQLNISSCSLNGSKAVLTTPGATKWYKSNGKPASQTVHLRVRKHAHLDYLPQENIFFDGVTAHSRLVIHQEAGSSAIAWEIHQLGRQASGESWKAASIALATEWHLSDRLVWVESSELDSLSPIREAAYGLDGFSVFGTMWLSAVHLQREQVEEVASTLPWSDKIRAGVTYLELEQGHGLMVLRALAAEVEDIKRLFIEKWMGLREPASGLPAQYLRLWNT